MFLYFLGLGLDGRKKVPLPGEEGLFVLNYRP